ncbi:hypothetical protein [Actinopolymorpha pittospori]|uniref:Uncharacterized protein n=1 Tax=Actinopolymorpha pittospori TaxID=648752 RepID=A0A927RNK6_9ACTN|nr:hypothetical protein [Actinopolymorpha pittospori]MBE1610173.1 hypothetical protein [Actinopolymorpha pittospori]
MAAFSYLRSRPYLLETGVDPACPGTQRARPITGIGLYAVSALAGWFVPPLRLALIVVMIAYHALTSEGLREGQFGRVLTARRGR